MSHRGLAAGLAAALTLAATLLSGSGPAGADDSAAPAAALQPDGLSFLGALTAEQIARRDAFAKRTGRAAADIRGPYYIYNEHSRLCLTVLNASTANNAPVIQYECDGGAPYNEQWYVDSVSADGVTARIINEHSDRCLTIQNASTADNGLALQFTCDNGAPYNERWQIRPIGEGGTPGRHIVNVHSRRCLTIQNASLSNHARALQFGCETSYPYNEDWWITAYPSPR